MGMIKHARYHAHCALECGVTNAEIIASDDMDCDVDGWDARCEACGEPSEAAQAHEAARFAYWDAYVSGGMRTHMREQDVLNKMSDEELEIQSRDCGRRLTRSES